MQVPRDVTYLELQNDILHNMVACLRDENFCKVRAGDTTVTCCG